MDRLILHVGTMKSGTTFLQDQLFDHQDQLRAQGILVPGTSWRDHDRGTKDVLGHDGREPGAWRRLLDTAAGPGTAVVSMEFFARARPEAARQVIASVDVPVHVVITARDLNRQLPAMWQETLQNGRTWSWRSYLNDAKATCPTRRRRADLTPPSRNFWSQQNLIRITDTWREAAGDGGLSLVTVPHPGAAPTALWERFATACGFDPVGMPPGPRRNESLGAASAQVLRRANELFEERGLPFPLGRTLRKRTLAKSVLAARKQHEPPIGLPVASWVVKHARRQIAFLETQDLRVLGSTSDLEPVAVAGIDPETVDPTDVAEAATDALVTMLAATIRTENARKRATAREENP